MSVDTECVIFGEPDAARLESLLDGPGDLWHSGLDRGYGGLLAELKYWNPDWWYLNDFDRSRSGVSWRVDSEAFVVRRRVWERLGGFDAAYSSEAARGLDFGFRLLKAGGVPLHVPGLFAPAGRERVLPREDVHLFFARHFRRDRSLYAFLREVMRRRRPLEEWRAFRRAAARARETAAPPIAAIPSRPLRALGKEAPKISVILPTMGRQPLAAQLLEDLARQTAPVHEVFVIDATPAPEREPGAYDHASEILPLRLLWEETPGACRQRNRAIRLSNGDYVVFADDDTRIPPDYLEQHVRLLETYGAAASNGVLVAAQNEPRTVRAEDKFGTGGSCVAREWVARTSGNDANFEGGYGEDSDLGRRIAAAGGVVLENPFASVLHLKAPSGGFRWWRRCRARLPWELKRRAGWIKPKPSPTIVYGVLKHCTPDQAREWFLQYLLRTWWPRFTRPYESTLGRLLRLVPRVLKTPLVLIRIRVACRFAADLLARRPRYD